MSENLQCLLLTLGYYAAFLMAGFCASLSAHSMWWFCLIYIPAIGFTHGELRPLFAADLKRMKRERGDR
jgi:hypothetical protein